MASVTTIRLPDPLKAEATTYAEGLGISLNALMAVALRDYLDFRKRHPEPPPAEAPPLDAYAEEFSEEPAPRPIPKVGRNEPCPCGSGKKYKLCHGR